MPAAIATFAVLDDLLGDAACFAGPAVSLADLMLAPQVDMLAGTPEWRDLAAAAPRVAAWLDRMAGRPALRETTWERIEARAGVPTEAA